METKIYRIEESDELGDYELEDIEKLNARWLVYYYEEGDYEGSGFAVWESDGKLYYHDMGHCSCYGPTEEMKNVMPIENISEIEKFADNYNSGDKVVEFIKDNKLHS